jgi:hypothetical protein
MPRWDKDREYVICGAPRGSGFCGGRVGRRVLDDAEADLFGILPGWERGRDGVWHEPRHDHDRRLRGYAPRPLPGSVSGKKRNRGESYFTPLFPEDGLPVRCSDCRTEHRLEAAALGVVPYPSGSVVTIGARDSA